ncbi:N-acetyltransferase [Mucilaginibacter limnophilus]|uniref:N-acetyltransferase n=1 Tax=Mucilaginibacter limnophilus TaxID=1932778 RepID=A0A3S2V3Y1_9SPHI|nr:GNAT family N-acetyltransferase [Mucilaginibacter limnophilus]RVU02765.1 N-acetyltransferase [Mucilaginibacter limnophilus]
MLILQTERLLLREFDLNDAPFILELLNTDEWVTNIGDFNVKTIDDAKGYLLSRPMEGYKKNGYGMWAVVIKETGQLIGMCGLIKRDTLDRPDIGYALLPQFTGKGYAFEMAEATLKYGMEKLYMQRIAAISIETNKPSINLLKKLGFSYEKQIRLSEDADELQLYSIIK